MWTQDVWLRQKTTGEANTTKTNSAKDIPIHHERTKQSLTNDLIFIEAYEPDVAATQYLRKHVHIYTQTYNLACRNPPVHTDRSWNSSSARKCCFRGGFPYTSKLLCNYIGWIHTDRERRELERDSQRGKDENKNEEQTEQSLLTGFNNPDFALVSFKKWQ